MTILDQKFKTSLHYKLQNLKCFNENQKKKWKKSKGAKGSRDS